MDRLGLIAGGGDLPVRIVAACRAQGRPLFVIRLKGYADAALQTTDGVDLALGEFGKCLDALKKAGCSSVCLAGKVSRPDFSTFKVDLKGMTLLPGIIAAARQGDDALLRQVLGVFADAGFAIEGADAILGGDQTLPGGALGAVRPRDADRADIEKALRVARAIGDLDVGQGAVVSNGLVLAVEAQEGTDAMLERVATLPVDLRGTAPQGVLAKAPKPIQERRVDLPVIGVRTIELAHAAGLAGIAGQAGDLIVIDRPGVIAAADRLGLFVWGEG
ncbi:MAG TPA: UDP-2,3-diacylglucosamine diphosphatase LpxI [Brevundimonas sp.]|uniref:UDP-2,3-diacylglucosamine diphosphatase n=1 Tax=Brevundimonas sp. TaxID=1871086 RepID=UPI002BBB2107|nr:UDP-2,3-diacylglucosamine diphosphatase LpxI [Brevundimonas sp.]HRH19504.1 UDP-2,3-diacylglucosamine diphosphatase LpxI [Brevundimonas sp.]